MPHTSGTSRRARKLVAQADNSCGSVGPRRRGGPRRNARGQCRGRDRSGAPARSRRDRAGRDQYERDVLLGRVVQCALRPHAQPACARTHGRRELWRRRRAHGLCTSMQSPCVLARFAMSHSCSPGPALVCDFRRPAQRSPSPRTLPGPFGSRRHSAASLATSHRAALCRPRATTLCGPASSTCRSTPSGRLRGTMLAIIERYTLAHALSFATDPSTALPSSSSAVLHELGMLRISIPC